MNNRHCQIFFRIFPNNIKVKRISNNIINENTLFHLQDILILNTLKTYRKGKCYQRAP